MRLAVTDIHEDPEVQLRDGLDMDRVLAMVEFEEQGGQLPPISVVGADNLLGDGHHRLAAARRSGKREIDANRIEGGKPEAVAAAIAGNDISTHSPLTRIERNKGVKLLLLAGWPQQRIADATGVHQTTIMDIHNALAMRGEIEKKAGPSRGPAGGRIAKPVTVLPKAVHEKLGDTVLNRIADGVPLAQQAEFAAAVAEVGLPEPRVREAIRVLTTNGGTPRQAVAEVTPQVRAMPATMPEVAKQVRRRLEHFLNEPMTVEGVERDFWAVLDVLAANADGIPLEARGLATLLAEVAVKSENYSSRLRSVEDIELLA